MLLLTKIVVFLILFPLCQLVSGGGFHSDPQGITYNLLKPFINIPPYPLGVSGPKSESKLPDKEVEALTQIASGLDLKTLVNQSLISIVINCTFFNESYLHITKIVMEGVRLTGEIPSNVIDLKYLQMLDLSNNRLHGSIPDQMRHLSNLTKLDLSQNQLTGEIPSSLKNWKNLRRLDLSQNLLSGKIPKSLGSLSSLEHLHLWSNQLSGDIPPELGNLSQLQILEIDENELTGTTPPELGKLSNLRELWLDSNSLEGELPQEYENLTNLEIFDAGGNNLSGIIPSYITNWVNLVVLELMGNNFKGILPPGIFNLSKLEHLWISDLKNSELVLPEPENLTNLYSLTMRNCNIVGGIPSFIASSKSLRYLDLSFNKLIGGVPDDFKSLKLDVLLIMGNGLNGTFPKWIYGIVQNEGDLSYNNFTFPDDLQMDPEYNATKIKIEPRNRTFPQQIMENHCPGEKYDSLFINAGGEEIRIEGNNYEADKSTSHFYVSPKFNWAYSCNGHQYTDESTNSSDFISKLRCGASFNTEEGPLYSNARLCPQSLIYYGFCLHNGNYTVKLRFSDISFSKDDGSSTSMKRVFDIYIQENLERKDFNIEQQAGGTDKIWDENFTVNVHENLLKIQLFWGGKGSIYAPSIRNGPLISAISVYSNHKDDGLSKAEIVGIVLAAIVLAMLLLLALMWRMGWIGDRELRVNKVTLRGKSCTLKQVKDATRNFSPSNEIGRGRFGIVYKAEFSDGQIVAVKKLPRQSKHVIDQIGTEVYTLKQLKNENIVELLDGYSNGDLHLLIYEYMGKGSLQRALFDQNSNVQLDWPTRVNISLGIAKGLKYLHHDNNTGRKIVHRNIKPSNILLDENLRAKVADFGLAKIYDEENPYKFIQEKGTVVYMAPEYAMRKAITDKVDVFSFGIVLLEIVSGQTNAKYDENQETVFLLDTAIVSHTKGRLFDLVDRNMPINRDVRKQAIEILELAMKCVDQSPTLRPTMSEIVSELEKISTVDTRSG